MAKEQTGISGEFWFISQLYRLGYEAYITLGNTKSVDVALKLNNNKILTFDVKSKENFNGCVPNLLNIPIKTNHYVAFLNLNISKDKITSKVKFPAPPDCYIIASKDIKHIAHNGGNWGGLTFEAKLLWFLKFQNTKSITQKNKTDFMSRHKLKTINFSQFDKIILTLDEFEEKFYKWK
jgi:hypothetical protein